jgi:sterol desaturase/sphingolipid hydroxylase (fatty acid hydroxylase superfamily)
MEILFKVQRHLLPSEIDFLRLCARLALLVVIFVPLERMFALRRQEIFRKAFLQDLGWYFLSSLLTGLIIIPPMAAAGRVLHFLTPAGFLVFTGGLPLGIRFAASMVVGEAGFYWGHRWSHEIPLLWRFHAIHHSAGEMDWLVNTRVHPVDMVFTRLCGFIPMFALGLAQPAARATDIVPLLVILTGTLWGFFIHANLNWRFGPLEWLIATPHFHHWHHTYEKPLDRNYAAMLPWIDLIFGTCHLPKVQWPLRYGTGTQVPEGLADQLVGPFTASGSGTTGSGTREAEWERAAVSPYALAKTGDETI